MRKLALLALAALVPTGSATAQTAPDVAPYAPTLTKPFRDAFALANLNGDEASIGAASTLATLPDEKYLVAAARYKRAAKLNQRREALIAVEDILASRSPLLSNRAELLRIAGNLAFELGDVRRSSVYLTGPEMAGQTDSQRSLMAADSLVRLKRYPEALAQFDQAVAQASATGGKPPESWYYRAISVARLANSTGDQARLGAALIRAYPTAENWRTVLMNYRDGARLGSDAQFDLARLLRTSGGLTGERDYLEFADLAIDRGAAAEAQGALSAGVANRIVQPSTTAAKAKIALASTRAKAARSKETAAAKKSSGPGAQEYGDLLLARGEHGPAANAYSTALARGGVNADEVNTRLGIALTRAGRTAEARQAFGAVAGNRGELARFWLLWLETQP